MIHFLVRVFTALFLTTSIASAAVWQDFNTWDAQWENKYNEWVRQEWKVDFFARTHLANGQSNPYYGLRVDCADTVYSMRLVFAYENKLPFVIQDPTTTQRTLSNKMSRWDSQKETDRVRGFLRFIYETVSTRSLPNDTYPVAITKEGVRSGGLMMTTKKNHHSWTVKEILPIGVPWLVFNSVVGAGTSLTLQQRQSWPNPEWVFEGNYTASGNAGFRYWKKSDDLFKPLWQVDGYSEEQYQFPLKQWVRTAQNRLAVHQENDQQMIARLFKTACEGAQGRVSVVQEGIDYLSKSGGRCMDYPTYDNYSTPNRDRRVFDDLVSLRRAYRDVLQLNGGKNIDADTISKLNKIFPQILESAKTEAANMPEQNQTAASSCLISYRSGSSIDLAEFKRRLFVGLMSNNPLDGLEYRWGEKMGPSERAKSCTSWDAWSPDLNQD